MAFPNSKTRRGRVGHGVAQTLTTSDAQQVVVVGNYSPSEHNASRIVDANGIAPTVMENHGTVTAITEPIAYDEQNGCLRKDGTVGTITTDGSSPKHNNRIVEPLVWGGYNQQVRADSSVCGTITRNVGADLKRNGQGIIEPSDYRFYQQAIETLKENDCEPGDTIDAYNKRVNKDGISPTITTRPDGFKTAILPVVDNNQYELSDAMKRYINSKDGKYNVNQSSLTVNRDIACAKTTREGSTRADASDYITDDLPDNASVAGVDLLPYRIRKLTPRECFRLMGVKREDYEAAAKHQSVSSQYHLTGDSIVTACLMAILGELLTIDYNTKITELTEGLLDADETNS